MLLNERLPKNVILAIHTKIISRLKFWANDLSNVKTGNTKLHTIIYFDVDELKSNDVILESNEYPFLECCLDNGNYFLMTTERMISEYLGKRYELNYQNFNKIDMNFYRRSKSTEEGLTKIYKYYSKKGDEFIYEIDSGFPAFFADRGILFYMIEAGERTLNGTITHFLDSQ